MHLFIDPTASAEQQAMVNEAVARSTFDWDRLTSTVALRYGVPDPAVHDDFETYAMTWIDSAPDHAGRPDHARVVVKDTLLTHFATGGGPPGRRWPNNPENGVYDVVHHELGHVLAAKLNTAQIRVIATAFGRSIVDWQDDRSLPWGERVLESFCETFKDIFLGEDRMWDNRALPLPRQNFEIYLNVLREICPAQPPSGYWEWRWPV